MSDSHSAPDHSGRAHRRSAAQNYPGETGNESALRRIVHALTDVEKPEQILQLIVRGALDVGRASGAYIERIVSDHTVEVVAAAGRATPALGTRVPYPGSLTADVIEKRQPDFILDLSQEKRPMAEHLGASCRQCAALGVPLISESEVLGALLLLRPHGDTMFTTADANRTQTLADVGSVLFRRLRLTEEYKRANLVLRVLAEVGHALGGSLDYRRTLGSLAQLVIPELADFCIVDVLEGDNVERIEVATADPSLRQIAWQYRAYPPQLYDGANPIARVLRTGDPELVPDITQDFLRQVARAPEQVALANQIGLRSLIVVPLVGRGRILGALSLLTAQSGRHYGPDDVKLAHELAQRAALAVDNARLFTIAERGQAEAEQRARTEEALRRAAAALSSAYTIKHTVHEIAQTALTACNADSAVVESVNVAADEVEVVAVAGKAVAVAGNAGLSVNSLVAYGGSLAQLVLERGRTEHIPVLRAGATRVSTQLLGACTGCSALAVPLADQLGPIGALILLRDPDNAQAFEPADRERARTFADLAAVAFRKAELLEDTAARRDELARASQSRSRLMRGFSHDMKNPLGAADGCMQLLEDGIYGELSSEQKPAVARARQTLHDAMKLVEDLLELARAEAGEIKVERETLDIGNLLTNIAEAYRAPAAVKNLTLEVSSPPELPVVENDPTRVREILGNLLSNAVKYTREGGIAVRVELGSKQGSPASASWLAIHVSDTGPGLSSEQQQMLFQEFQRLETAGEEKGSGIGLAISRHIARRMGGDVTVSSIQGAGSTFTLWLPISETAPSVEA